MKASWQEDYFKALIRLRLLLPVNPKTGTQKCDRCHIVARREPRGPRTSKRRERPEADVRPGRCRECWGAPKRCRAHDGCVLRAIHDTARSLNVQPVRGSNASSPGICIASAQHSVPTAFIS